MKRSAILVLAFATAVPAFAQRAGAHARIALHSGPTAHPAPMFRSGFTPASGFHNNAHPFIRGTRAYPAQPPRFAQPPLRYPAIAPPPASRFYQRNHTYSSTRRIHRFPVIAYPTSVIGLLPDTGLYDDTSNDPSDPAQPTASQQPDYGDNTPPPPSPYYPDYGAEYAQYPQPGEAPPAAQVPSSTANAETVTLIFNNGQPPQQIQNYLATRTTVTVIDGARRREIPVAELDVPATIKANRAAGIDFSLPTSTP
jgi:hypothetical protein